MDFIRLWMHESQRVYGDKLIDDKDVDAFCKVQVDIIKKNFDVSYLTLVLVAVDAEI